MATVTSLLSDCTEALGPKSSLQHGVFMGVQVRVALCPCTLAIHRTFLVFTSTAGYNSLSMHPTTELQASHTSDVLIPPCSALLQTYFNLLTRVYYLHLLILYDPNDYLPMERLRIKLSICIPFKLQT